MVVVLLMLAFAVLMVLPFIPFDRLMPKMVNKINAWRDRRFVSQAVADIEAGRLSIKDPETGKLLLVTVTDIESIWMFVSQKAPDPWLKSLAAEVGKARGDERELRANSYQEALQKRRTNLVGAIFAKVRKVQSI